MATGQPTIKDIAERATCSTATVSRVINKRGDSMISPQTRQRVMAAAVEMGYRPNRAARTLAIGRTQIVALLTPTIYLPFYAMILHHVQAAAQADGYEIIVSDLESYAGDPEKLLLAQWPVDGLLTFDDGHDDTAALIARVLPDKPRVMMGLYRTSESSCVIIEQYDSTVEATKQLIAGGCRRIAHLLRHREAYPDDSRYAAYTSTMTDAGLTPEYIITGDALRTSARRAVIASIRAEGHPDGILAHNDDLALGAYRAVLDSGLHVPEDVAIIGCDGIEDTEYLEKPLSTILQPVEEMCRQAWQMLRRHIETPGLPFQCVTLKSQFAVRSSSARR